MAKPLSTTSLTARRERRAARPEPSQALSEAAPRSAASVVASTSTLARKIPACTKVGHACPTLSVPGSKRSSTDRRARQSAAVVAYEPMPSVSKKSVTKPTARSQGEGHASRNLRMRTKAKALNASATAPSAKRST